MIQFIEKVSTYNTEKCNKFVLNTDKDDVKLDNNLIEIQKKNADMLKFELHAFGDTKLIMNEIKAFKLDEASMSECFFLTKYFGPYQITKTTEDQFIFSKNGESAILSKRSW